MPKNSTGFAHVATLFAGIHQHVVKLFPEHQMIHICLPGTNGSSSLIVIGHPRFCVAHLDKKIAYAIKEFYVKETKLAVRKALKQAAYWGVYSHSRIGSL